MNTALNRTSVALLTNKSGGSVAQGDVVIVDGTTAASFTTTTTSAYVSGSVGVVLEPNGIASNAIGSVAFGGYVPIVNLSGSASLGDVFKTHSVAKQAVRHAGPIVAGDFGQVLGTGTTPAAFLWAQPSGGGGGGSSTFAGDTDVSISGVANLDQIQYQTGDSKYHNVKGGMVRLDETIVGVSPVASVTLTPVSGYRGLMIDWIARGDTSANFTQVLMQMNADTGANYDVEGLGFSGTGTPASNETVAGTSAPIGFAAAATATSGYPGGGSVRIPVYGGTTFKKVFVSWCFLVTADTSGNRYQENYFGDWRSTSAITSILIKPAAGNFIQDSTFTLYGLV